MNENLTHPFLNDIKSIIEQSRDNAIRSGFGLRQLERARQFYRLSPIASAVRSQLNWSQYRMLIQIEDKDKREYYELEPANNNWTGREEVNEVKSLMGGE